MKITTTMKITKQKTTLAGIGTHISESKRGEKYPARIIKTLDIIEYDDNVKLAFGYEPRARRPSCTVAIVDGIAYSISTNPQHNAQEMLEKMAKEKNSTPARIVRNQVEELMSKGLINL